MNTLNNDGIKAIIDEVVRAVAGTVTDVIRRSDDEVVVVWWRSYRREGDDVPRAEWATHTAGINPDSGPVLIQGHYGLLSHAEAFKDAHARAGWTALAS